MHEFAVPEPPPAMDSFAPEFCFCGKKTVESHEFWFCSTQCARLDSLRSLGDPECHYRDVVRKAYVRAGIPELYPRRMMSADELCSNPAGKYGLANPPSRVPPPTWSTLTRNNTHDPRTGRIPTLPQVASKISTRKASTGEPRVAARQDRPRLRGFPIVPSRNQPIQGSGPLGSPFEQVSLESIPLPEHVPARSLRHVPPSSDGLKGNIRKSVAALLNVGRSRRAKEDEKSGMVFGRPKNVIIPPVRKESLSPHHQTGRSLPTPAQKSNLRRSASFAGRDTTPHSGSSNEHNTLMHIIAEMREDCSESFDPRSWFDKDEAY